VDRSPVTGLAPHASVSSRSVVALFLVAVVALAGCTTSSVPPSPTPADFGGLSVILQGRGLTIVDVVSGDAGCPDASLAQTAISFKASGLDQATPVQVYLYIFNNHDVFVRRSTDVGGCASSYVTDPQTYESLAISPYVLSGQGPWAPAFLEQLRAGLTTAAGDGGTSGGNDGE
jgi:hypothetical protein